MPNAVMMERPPWPEVLARTAGGIVLCACGTTLTAQQGVHSHWLAGHFDKTISTLSILASVPLDVPPVNVNLSDDGVNDDLDGFSRFIARFGGKVNDVRVTNGQLDMVIQWGDRNYQLFGPGAAFFHG